MKKNAVEYLHEIYKNNGTKELLKELNRNNYGSFSLEEIGQIIGVTRERVRQIESGAIKKLKHPKMAIKLKRYIADGGIKDITSSDHF